MVHELTHFRSSGKDDIGLAMYDFIELQNKMDVTQFMGGEAPLQEEYLTKRMLKKTIVMLSPAGRKMFFNAETSEGIKLELKIGQD